MWISWPGRWRGRAGARQAAGVEWKVGVLRPGVENIAWTDRGDGKDWPSARRAALAALHALAEKEGRQEYRIQVGDVEGMSWPGIDDEGQLDTSIMDEVMPVMR